MTLHFQFRKAFAFAAKKIFGHAQTEHPTVRCEQGLQRCVCHSARQSTHIQSGHALLQVMRQRLRCRVVTQRNQAEVTFSAWRPFWPCVTSKLTRWPSCNVRKPDPEIARK